MPEFQVRTWEHVAGTYRVWAETEAEARARFERKPASLVDWDGVAQDEYEAFSVEVREVVNLEQGGSDV